MPLVDHTWTQSGWIDEGFLQLGLFELLVCTSLFTGMTLEASSPFAPTRAFTSGTGGILYSWLTLEEE